MRKNHSAAQAVVKLIQEDPKIRKAILEECRKAGSPLTKQAIHDWRNSKLGVPLARVPIVARVLKLELHEIRPDVFTPPYRRSRHHGCGIAGAPGRADGGREG